MTYVDAIHDQKKNLIRVAERDKDGVRRLVDLPAEYVLYYTHPSGGALSMYGDSCKKFSTNDGQKFRKEQGRLNAIVDRNGNPKHKIFESDINPVFRALEKHYKGVDAPKLNVAFFDIETGFDAERGYAPVDNPFNAITAISLHLTQFNKTIALALCPPTLTEEVAREICNKFDDTFLFTDEVELLRTFCALVEDSDVMSGWNCLARNEPVWLQDRIVKLGDIKTGDQTLHDGKVLATNNSGMKRTNRLTLANGQMIMISDEHRIPVRTAPSHHSNDMTVADVKSRIAHGDQFFMELSLRANTNEGMTYRSYLLDNLDALWDRDDFDVVVDASDKATLSEAREYMRTAGFVYVKCASSEHHTYALDDPIPVEAMRLLGEVSSGKIERSYLKENQLLLPMIDGGLNIEMFSRVSYDQFIGFANSVIQHGIADAESASTVCELLLWNGVYSVIDGSHLSIMESLPPRIDDALIVAISIEETDEMVEMADIMTENEYFTCRGARVHNSTLYDIPYIVNRIRNLDPDLMKELCLWGQNPRQRFVPKFGRDHETYDLVGRVHLDYLELYQKHNPQQQQSYRLDFIGEIEVGDNKVPYEGTLDDLYKKDFFKFIEYSRQDVDLLVKIDQKKKFIELANQIAHVNCVQLKTTMGSVALVEQAILLEMHEMGLVAPNRKPKKEDEPEVEDIRDIDLHGFFGDDDEDDDEDGAHYVPFKVEKKPVVGAYVAKPKVGLHSHVACVDINSLYPSTIRALNLSPETIVGQLRSDETKALIQHRIDNKVKRAEAWDGIFASLEVSHMHARDDAELIVDFDDGTSRHFTGATLHDYIFNPANKLCISANGTIFRTDKDGIIPLLLAKWYRERKEMQGKSKQFAALTKGIEVDADLAKQIEDQLALL